MLQANKFPTVETLNAKIKNSPKILKQLPILKKGRHRSLLNINKPTGIVYNSYENEYISGNKCVKFVMEKLNNIKTFTCVTLNGCGLSNIENW